MTPAGGADKWIEIDVDSIRHNLQQVNAMLDERVRLIAVLKARAYGHGAIEVARLLYQNGVDFFAVSFLEEALLLRRNGIRASVLLFAPLISEEQIREAIENYVTISIASQQEAYEVERISRNINRTAAVHLKIETGLGRFGLNSEEAVQCCQVFKTNPNIYIEGIYTHMAEAAARNPRYTQDQFHRFMDTVSYLESAGFKIPVKHCANSAVVLNYPHMHLNAVRVGTLLSGQHPVGRLAKHLQLKDPYRFKCRIISLRNAEKGSYVGYHRTYRLKKPAKIAVLPVGYCDGLALEVNSRPAGLADLLKIVGKTILKYFNLPRLQLKVIYKGGLYPVRGKVFMQLSLVEFPAHLEVQVGDEVEVPIRKTLAAGNVVRLYVREGQAGKIGDEQKTSYVVEEE